MRREERIEWERRKHPKRWKALVALPAFLPWLPVTIIVQVMIAVGRAGEWIDDAIPPQIVGWPLRNWMNKP